MDLASTSGNNEVAEVVTAVPAQVLTLLQGKTAILSGAAAVNVVPALRVTVLVAPVKVGKNAKTGAGSILLADRNIPNGQVFAGVPAKKIGNRK